MVSGLEFERRVFRRSQWGPLHLVAEQWGAQVSVSGGPTVAIDFRKVRAATTPEQERWGSLRLGIPILIDGAPRAVATSVGSDQRGLIRPGKIRIEGDDPRLFPAGLTLRGHLLPQRCTLESDAGRLVWSPWPLGLANLHSGPVLLVPPRHAQEAVPVHVALWLVAWFVFEGQF